MGKAVITSSCSPQGTRRSLRIKLKQTKRKQLKRDLSKPVQPRRGEIKPQRRRRKRAQSLSGDKVVQSKMGKSKCMRPKRRKLIQPKYRIPTRVQPKRGKLAQSKHGKTLGVKPQPRKPKCFHSRRPKFIQRRRGSLIQQRRRRPKCNEKQPKPTKQLPEITQQPNASTPVSLRIQIKMAIKESQEITPAEVSLPNERSKRMDVKKTRKTYPHYLKKNHIRYRPCQDGELYITNLSTLQQKL